MHRVICPKCDYTGLPAKKKRGSGRTEMLCWLMFPLGIPYTLWRMFGKIPVCKGCGHDMLIDEESPVGQRMLERIYGVSTPTLKPEGGKAMPPAPPPPKTVMQPREPKPWRPEHDPEQF